MHRWLSFAQTMEPLLTKQLVFLTQLLASYPPYFRIDPIIRDFHS